MLEAVPADEDSRATFVEEGTHLDEQATIQSSYHMLVFALGGTSYGMVEETLAFRKLVIPAIN